MRVSRVRAIIALLLSCVFVCQLAACDSRQAPAKRALEIAAPAPLTVAAAEPVAKASTPKPAIPRARRDLYTPDRRVVALYPPRAPDAHRAPLVVMLHGACMDPIDTCDRLRDAGRAQGFVACPAGNRSCGDAFDWAGPTEERIAAIDESLAAVEDAYGPLFEHEGDILIGFSRGAFLARDLVYARPRRYRGVVLIGAAMVPDADRFLASGVRRVVLAAGDYDSASATMRRAAAILTARGLPARFVSLGRIYHALPADPERWLGEALRWVREGAGSG